MSTQTMSVTRALAELKVLGDRITKATNNVFIGAGFGVDAKPDRGTKEEIEATLRANFQSVEDLIKRRSAIKAAVVASNATTTVVVGNKTMTVAEAIETKGAIDFKQALVNTMKQQALNVDNFCATKNRELEQRVETQVQTVLGKDAKKEANYSEVYEALRKPLYDRFEAKPIDPLGVVDLVKKSEEEISDFNLNVDFALSEVNAKTEITITV